MRQFSPNCFEKISHEQHRAATPGPCTLMSCLTASQIPGHWQVRRFARSAPEVYFGSIRSSSGAVAYRAVLLPASSSRCFAASGKTLPMPSM